MKKFFTLLTSALFCLGTAVVSNAENHQDISVPLIEEAQIEEAQIEEAQIEEAQIEEAQTQENQIKEKDAKLLSQLKKSVTALEQKQENAQEEQANTLLEEQAYDKIDETSDNNPE